MDKTFLELCSRYEDVAPAEIPAAAMKVADAACAQLQTVHDTVPAGEQTAAAKEIIAAVSGVKKALLDRVEQFHDELNPNVLSAFHDACAQYAGAACGMMHIVGNRVEELFPDSKELSELAASARAVGDTVSFPYQMVKEGDKYVVELTHIHDGKPVDENPAPQKVIKSYRYHIVQKDGKYIVEQG